MVILRALGVRSWRLFLWAFTLAWLMLCVAMWVMYSDLSTAQRVAGYLTLAVLSPDIHSLLKKRPDSLGESRTSKWLRPKIVVAEIWVNRILVHNPTDGTKIPPERSGEFSSGDALVADESAAERVIKEALADYFAGRLIQSPWIVLHPREGRYDVRRLREIGFAVGASRVAVFEGGNRPDSVTAENLFSSKQQ